MQVSPHILIVDDHREIRDLVSRALSRDGFRVSTAADGQAMRRIMGDNRIDLILLDLMLPKVNGYEICRFLREEKMEMPILILTAKGQESDVVLGLKLGADDYVTKPFSIKELLARVDAFLRRRRQQAGSTFEFGDCRFDTAARKLSRAGAEIVLSPKEFELLAFLAANAGRALSRDRIMSSVWGYDCQVTPRSIDRFINALRGKIEADPARPRFIQTVREFGYKFEPE